MRKFKIILIAITSLFAVLTVTACKQFLADIEKDLEYWATEAAIIETDSFEHLIDKDGFASVVSSSDLEILLKVRNPQKYSFLLPGDSTQVIAFSAGQGYAEGSLSVAPASDTDYTLEQINDKRLKLTYKSAVLKKNEYGEAVFSPVITLFDKSSRRKFKETFTFKIKANTPPRHRFPTILAYVKPQWAVISTMYFA